MFYLKLEKYISCFILLMCSVFVWAKDPLLLTPGPLTTTSSVKEAMLHDLGSRDLQFLEANKRVMENLVQLAEVANTHVAVPIQGSGTFAVEAMIGTLVPRNKEVLILANGVYGKRMAEICDYLKQPYILLEKKENQAFDLNEISAALEKNHNISHVAIVHCETSSGRLNSLEKISPVVAKHQRALLIDAMSSFGAITIDPKKVVYEGLAASANKCLQGVPGLAFCIINKESLQKAKNNSHSLSLDLHAQWKNFTTKGQWRFTPPVQSILALDQAITELKAEGGIAARYQRYQNNCKTLDAGMKALGFKSFLKESEQAPIILTYFYPNHPNFNFEKLYQSIKEKGFIIYPGKLTQADTFRVGCIGALDEKEMHQAVLAFHQALDDLNIQLATIEATDKK